MSTAAPQLRVVTDETRHAAPVDPRDREAVFRRFAPYVARIGYRLLGRPEEGEDLVQDVFLSAQRGLDDLRDEGAIKGWLATVAVRKAQRRLRKRRFRMSLGLDEEVDYATVADEGADPAQRALLSQVYEALDRLPTNERVAWSLRHIEGEKLQDVAELCGCSLATIKRRIAAAHARLLEELEELGE
jgi:RNA polymerase sigma-70 factor (ECF subfamily)